MFEMVPFSPKGLLPGTWLRDFFADDLFSGPALIKADIFSQGDTLVIEAELPGFSKDEVTVRVEDHKLTISAQRKAENEEKAENYLRRERSLSRVCRTFLIEDLDPESIRASFTNGLLRLTASKPLEPAAKTKEIEIE